MCKRKELLPNIELKIQRTLINFAEQFTVGNQWEVGGRASPCTSFSLAVCDSGCLSVTPSGEHAQRELEAG